MSTIRDYLWELPSQSSPYNEVSLPKLGRLAGIRPFPKQKAKMVDELVKYYSFPSNIVDVLKRLNPFERELIEERVRSSGPLGEDEIEKIVKKHNIKAPKSDRSYYYGHSKESFADYFGENSPARVLFLKKSFIPGDFLTILRKHVTPFEIKYTPVEKFSLKDGIIGEIVLREGFKDDFIKLIRLINTAKLSVTKQTSILAKSAAIKINSVLGCGEILVWKQGVEEIRNVKETTRIFGLYMLLISSGIIRAENGSVVLTPKSGDIVKQSPVEMCSTLLNAYIEASSINELDRVRELKIKTAYHSHFKKCRETILKHLRKCPIDEWISMSEFLNNIKKTDRYYLTEQTGEILSYSEYDRYYYARSQGWHEIEGRFIEVVLLEYLHAMGIIDAAVAEGCHYSDYGDHKTEYLSLEYFKLTPMGAFVIGATDKYKPMAEEETSGFVVQPNFDIIISEGKHKQVHNLFFDRFAEKIADDVASIYRLNFKSIVNALDSGITVHEIIEYLERHCNNPLPDNVRKTLEDWKRESKRITIRKITIVETDDKYLMEELKNSKSISKYIQKELIYAVEINGKASVNIKREIEKKNHFCIIE
jgi:hypothetical protein